MKVSLSFGTLRQWHWISSALCLVGMLLFAITGITLNHAAQIEARPSITLHQAQLPKPLQNQLLALDPLPEDLSPALRTWLEDELSLDLASREVEWEDGELYIGLPRPGGDAWLSLDLISGELLYESTDRGWIAYFNDLHKGRHSGVAWSWFIDVFAGVCVLFCLTGLLLMQRYASGRPTTWPVLGLGLLVPLLLALLFIH